MNQRSVETWIGRVVAVATVLCIVGMADVAQAQVSNVVGNTASQNASSGSADGRAPGNMVRAGVFRAQEAVFHRFDFSHITQTARPVTWRDTFLLQAVQILMQDLNTAAALVANLMVRRADIGSTTAPTDGTPADNGTTRDPPGR